MTQIENQAYLFGHYFQNNNITNNENKFIETCINTLAINAHLKKSKFIILKSASKYNIDYCYKFS